MFNDALQTVLKHEGYYANVVGDRGGETYQGIARKFHPDWTGWEIIDQEKKNRGGRLQWNHKVQHPLLDGFVARFYKTKFWDRIMLDQVNDENMQHIIFDAYVNMGANAIVVLQRVLNSLGKNIAVDGGMGPITVRTVNSVNPETLFSTYKKARVDYYRAIATGSNAKFLKGWLRRINSFNYKVVGLSIAGVLLVGLAGFFL
jgi:lysozyme family protein